jgi:hypothetical protein
MASIVRWGILSTGSIAHDFVHALRFVEGIAVCCVAAACDDGVDDTLSNAADAAATSLVEWSIQQVLKFEVSRPALSSELRSLPKKTDSKMRWYARMHYSMVLMSCHGDD